MNFEALHLSFASVVRLFGFFLSLKSDVVNVMNNLTVLKFFSLMFKKLFRIFSRAESFAAESRFHDAWLEQEAGWNTGVRILILGAVVAISTAIFQKFKFSSKINIFSDSEVVQQTIENEVPTDQKQTTESEKPQSKSSSKKIDTKYGPPPPPRGYYHFLCFFWVRSLGSPPPGFEHHTQSAQM